MRRKEGLTGQQRLEAFARQMAVDLRIRVGTGFRVTIEPIGANCEHLQTVVKEVPEFKHIYNDERRDEMSEKGAE